MSTIVVEHERQRFVWNGRSWYNELDYRVPRPGLIRILESLISVKDRRDMTVEAHKDYLAAHGLTQGATGKPKKSSHRETCRTCRRKSTKPAEVEVECAACHWIVCVCGACGCAAAAKTDKQS
jgi:hypothetical protein